MWNEMYQVQQCMDATHWMIRRCQGAWTSMTESFALLDKEVGDVLYLTEDSEAGEEWVAAVSALFFGVFCCFCLFVVFLCVLSVFCVLGKKIK
jgi:hypothetical protein